MPGLDGTGPRGEGPMTGRGEGYCAVKFPDTGEPPYGYAGIQGTPVRLDASTAWFTPWRRFVRRLRPAGRPGRGRGRGGRFARW